MKGYPIKIVLSILIIFLISSCSFSLRRVIILCVGDSITESEYPRFLQEIFNKENIRAKVLNYGRIGHTSGEYLNFLEKNKTALAKSRPDFILLQLGTNDVRVDADRTSAEQFYLNMKEIIEIFRGFRNRIGEEPQILLATIPPVPEGTPFPFSRESSARVRDEINPLIQKICSEEKILLVDNYFLFLYSPHLLPEVHPTKEGYRYLAQNWYKALEPLL